MLVILSTAKPAIAAITALEARILSIRVIGAPEEISSGSISSDVERKIARSVPVVITLPA